MGAVTAPSRPHSTISRRRSSKSWRSGSTRRPRAPRRLRPRRWSSARITTRGLDKTHGINESILVLLLQNIGDDLTSGRWTCEAAGAGSPAERTIGTGVNPARASEWIVRMLLIFDLLPPIDVKLDSPRAVRRFVSEDIVAGLAKGSMMIRTTFRRRPGCSRACKGSTVPSGPARGSSR